MLLASLEHRRCIERGTTIVLLKVVTHHLLGAKKQFFLNHLYHSRLIQKYQINAIIPTYNYIIR